MIANDFVDQLDLDVRVGTMKHQMIANAESFELFHSVGFETM